MKKQLLSGIAVGLMVALVPTVVLGSSWDSVTEVAKEANEEASEKVVNPRSGAFWDKLKTADTPGNDMIETKYAGSHERAFNDTSTYNKSLASKAKAKAQAAQAIADKKYNVLTNTAKEGMEEINRANDNLRETLSNQKAVLDNKVTEAQEAVNTLQRAYDTASESEKEAIEKQLEAAKKGLETAEDNRDNFQKYMDLKETEMSAPGDIAAAESELEDANARLEIARQNQIGNPSPENEAALKAAVQEQTAAQENLNNVTNKASEASKAIADAETAAKAGLSEEETTAFNIAVSDQKQVVEYENSKIADAEKEFNDARKEALQADSVKNAMQSVARYEGTQADVDEAVASFKNELDTDAENERARREEQRVQYSESVAAENQQKRDEYQANLEQQRAANQAARDRQELLSGKKITNAIKETTSPITDATKTLSSGVKDVTTGIQKGVGDAVYDAYKYITE